MAENSTHVPRCLVMRTVLSNRPAFYDAYFNASSNTRVYFHLNLAAFTTMCLMVLVNNFSNRPRGYFLKTISTASRLWIAFFGMEFFRGYFTEKHIKQHRTFWSEDVLLTHSDRLMIFGAGLLAVVSVLVAVIDLFVAMFRRAVNNRNQSTRPPVITENSENSEKDDVMQAPPIIQHQPRPWVLQMAIPLLLSTYLLFQWCDYWAKVTDGWCEAWEGVQQENLNISRIAKVNNVVEGLVSLLPPLPSEYQS